MKLTASKPIKVLCVDDNRFIGEALKIKLRLAGGFEWLGYLPDAEHLLEVVRDCEPNVVLLDIDMPGRSPFQALRDLSRHCPHVRVLMLTGHVRTELIDRAIEEGAWGYVSKNEAGAIIQAIRQVAAGDFVMSPDVQAAHGRW